MQEYQSKYEEQKRVYEDKGGRVSGGAGREGGARHLPQLTGRLQSKEKGLPQALQAKEAGPSQGTRYERENTYLTRAL